MTYNEKTLTILVVDDDHDFLVQQSLMLKAYGHTVIEAESREDAEKILLEKKPDLAVIDLMMREKDDGFVLSYFIKKRYPDLPVIIVTAVTSETGMNFSGNVKQSSWIKADAMLSKPIRYEQLKREIERLCF
jgi:CheY-like chemotaxis protein